MAHRGACATILSSWINGRAAASDDVPGGERSRSGEERMGLCGDGSKFVLGAGDV